MTGFLMWWLLGEVFYWLATRDEPTDDLDLFIDELEREVAEAIGRDKLTTPRDHVILRRAVVIMAVTVFFFLPLLWPLVVIPEDGDDWFE